jgi:hypothetical protein
MIGLEGVPKTRKRTENERCCAERHHDPPT